jgi:hypothetical protein
MVRLREYVGDVSRSLFAVVPALEEHFGQLHRVGGPTRVYAVDGGEEGAIYMMANGVSALGFGVRDNLVTTIYYWQAFDLDRAPEYSLDLPAGDFYAMAPVIVEMINSQQEGARPL